MTRIDELLAEQCPDGVQYLRLGDFFSIRRGTSITKTQAIPGTVPVVAGGRKAAYFHNKSNRESDIIVIAGSGAYAGYVSWWGEPVFVSDAFSIEPANPEIQARYCYFWLLSQQQQLHDLKKGGGVPHVYPKDVARLMIPVPPLEVQIEIVRILDQFTALEVALEAELEARRTQQEQVQKAVFADAARAGGNLMALRDVGTWYGGGTPSKSRQEFWHDGTIPWISPKDMGGSIVEATEDYITVAAVQSSATKLVPKEAVALVVRSSILEHTLPVAFVPMAAALNQDMKAVIAGNGISSRYVFHAIRAARKDLLRAARRTGGSVASLESGRLLEFEIPVPSEAEQGRIVEILDNFDELVNDLSVGLPAVLVARRKQHEYYREKLLTFKELAA